VANSGRTHTALSHQICSANEPHTDQVMLLKVRGMITVTHSVSAVLKMICVGSGTQHISDD